MCSTMGMERVTGLTLMHVEYGMELNFDEIINIFAEQHPPMLKDAFTDIELAS